MFAVSAAFLPTRTFFIIVWADGVNVSVPSKTIFSPSSKSKTSSSKKDYGICSWLPCSNSIPSLNVDVCSCSTLMTFSNVESKTLVFES